MSRGNWKEPNEASIAQTANCALIERLGSDESWVFAPSNSAEAQLGFDADLRHTKLGLIQYKRASVHSRGVSVVISRDQHAALRQFGKGVAFFAFGTFHSYQDLDLAQRAGHVLDRLLFVDAYAIPPGVRTLRLETSAPFVTDARSDGQLVPFKNGRRTKKGSPPEYRSGREWCQETKTCWLLTDDLSLLESEGVFDRGAHCFAARSS